MAWYIGEWELKSTQWRTADERILFARYEDSWIVAASDARDARVLKAMGLGRSGTPTGLPLRHSVEVVAEAVGCVPQLVRGAYEGINVVGTGLTIQRRRDDRLWYFVRSGSPRPHGFSHQTMVDLSARGFKTLKTAFAYLDTVTDCQTLQSINYTDLGVFDFHTWG